MNPPDGGFFVLVYLCERYELFDSGQGCVEQHEEAIYAAQQYTTDKRQFKKYCYGGLSLELGLLFHRELFWMINGLVFSSHWIELKYNRQQFRARGFYDAGGRYFTAMLLTYWL